MLIILTLAEGLIGNQRSPPPSHSNSTPQCNIVWNVVCFLSTFFSFFMHMYNKQIYPYMVGDLKNRFYEISMIKIHIIVHALTFF